MNATKAVYRSYLMDKVMPAIVASWPGPPARIVHQHDNAKAHVTADDEGLQVKFYEMRRSGWSFELVPHMNVLDLEFFAALQSLQHRESARSIDQLTQHSQSTHMSALDRTFLTLQTCMVETLKVAGDNTYKIPHLSKSKNAAKGRLPRNATCPGDVQSTALALLGTHESSRLERLFEKELVDLRSMNELTQSLENIALDDSEDIILALDDVDIEAIDISDD
ncbi:Aste57867_16155 [Aphanomyces stellatus]|uniref:Aste57867_16155 protein n=1 Tax=Aphanomyces stellatus TaxID=120398 RepID=A0A485L5J7_9STRA|nr:hypothetical protein As57867_016099 [Aphanomyces stellatus]VFT92935.1 Aste57867_16155 [Aphanomyces stellatus]